MSLGRGRFSGRSLSWLLLSCCFFWLGSDVAAVGDVLENPVSGERVVFRRLPGDDGGVLEMDHWWPVGHRVGEHVHPEMEERWLVVEGSPCFRIGEVERAGEVGDRVVAAAGVPHMSWNAGDVPVQVRIQMWPGLGWAEFVERLFGLSAEEGDGRPGASDAERLLELVRDFPREIALP